MCNNEFRYYVLRWKPAKTSWVKEFISENTKGFNKKVMEKRWKIVSNTICCIRMEHPLINWGKVIKSLCCTSTKENRFSALQFKLHSCIVIRVSQIRDTCWPLSSSMVLTKLWRCFILICATVPLGDKQILIK